MIELMIGIYPRTSPIFAGQRESTHIGRIRWQVVWGPDPSVLRDGVMAFAGEASHRLARHLSISVHDDPTRSTLLQKSHDERTAGDSNKSVTAVMLKAKNRSTHGMRGMGARPSRGAHAVAILRSRAAASWQTALLIAAQPA